MNPWWPAFILVLIMVACLFVLAMVVWVVLMAVEGMMKHLNSPERDRKFFGRWGRKAGLSDPALVLPSPKKTSSDEG